MCYKYLRCWLSIHRSDLIWIFISSTGIEGEFQLRTVLSSLQRASRKIPRWRAALVRLSVQRSRRLPRGKNSETRWILFVFRVGTFSSFSSFFNFEFLWNVRRNIKSFPRWLPIFRKIYSTAEISWINAAFHFSFPSSRHVNSLPCGSSYLLYVSAFPFPAGVDCEKNTFAYSSIQTETYKLSNWFLNNF